MWNCSELEESPRSIWQTSRYFILPYTQYHILKRGFSPSNNLIIKKINYHCCFFFYIAFGFCEYKEPESTLRALRLLHDLQIGDKNLLVKVDAKTKAQLDEWKARKNTANGV